MSESDACIAQGAVDAIKKLAPGFVPVIALTLGSGCGDVANAIEDAITIDYKDIPGFPISSVQGHAGQLILGKLGGVNVVGLKGRVHYYEGNPRAMVIPVYAAKLLGAKTIFITNAAGSLREEMGPGALVALTDHMNFSGANPLIGVNDSIGPRFPSLFQAYDPRLREVLHSVAKASNITLHEVGDVAEAELGCVLHAVAKESQITLQEGVYVGTSGPSFETPAEIRAYRIMGGENPLNTGVYVGTSGPSFETPAEIRAYRIMGGDVVGMSTVGEVILARHCGLQSSGEGALMLKAPL
ncbi:nucleoside phosphorylase domain-containing protein [Baffinella frigidus]|nr:nucleoside phosphorylase domain-containing protein [Cryptophyta sp. CCMP2293]